MDPMKVPVLKIPFDRDDAREIALEFSDMLLEGRLAMGRNVAAFEGEFKKFVGSAHACGCSSGTAALEMIFRALGDGAGPEAPRGSMGSPGSVALPANTYMATALAAIAAGYKVILVDNDPVYFQMCPDDLARKIRPDTRAVVLVHIGGFITPRWGEIRDLAGLNGAAFIEDAAHAHGAEIDGKTAGTLGLASAFSFYPTKVLTTAEGGMVTTSDDKLMERLLYLRQHGQERPGSNVHGHFGLNYRPSEIHALLGLRMMAKARRILDERRSLALVYDKLLSGLEIVPVLPAGGHKPAYYKYMALLPEGVDRETVKTRLREEFEVALAGEVYAVPGHRQPLWARHPEYLAAPLEPLPNAEDCAARQICLPIWPGLTMSQQEYVVSSLDKVLKSLKKDS
ncbi:MAG: DegT/DnrJ/EryC1/StrS family aminotransferase [Deltaproteobacteria bacterium]|jgi:dTDP-4-amino-4,6-dideoxygalactose transaminase|nr:DegT/DnrJ/EryC1/StrS family aminotransferase [Deltaproteobacteria bacterium]